jgi:hypothetical protein
LAGDADRGGSRDHARPTWRSNVRSGRRAPNFAFNPPATVGSTGAAANASRLPHHY